MVRTGFWCGVLMLAATAAVAQDAPPTMSENYDELFRDYLASARAVAAAPPAPDTLWMAGLKGDLRARRVNDLVTIRVVEFVSAQGSADSSLDKNSSGSASVGSLFGLESRFPGWLDPTSLASLGASTSFQGGGSTQRNGSLTAVLTARVAEVLPNGDLALEGIADTVRLAHFLDSEFLGLQGDWRLAPHISSICPYSAIDPVGLF